MSSHQAARPLHAHGLALVRDVLRTAGLRGVNSDASSDVKRDASIFVVARFRSGIQTKLSLLKALARRAKAAVPDPGSGGSPNDGAAAVPQDQGGR